MTAAVSRLRSLLAHPIANYVVRGGHVTFLRLTSTAITLAFGIVAAGLLGAEVFGGYVSLMAIAGVAATATSIGLPSLLAREIASSRGSGDAAALKPLAQGIFVLNAALVIVVAGTFALGWDEIGLVLLFALAGNAVGTLGAAYSGFERVLFAGWVASILRPSVTIATLWMLAQVFEPSIRLPVLAQIGGAAVAATVLLIFWCGVTPAAAVPAVFRAAWWSPRHRALLRLGGIFAGNQLLINLTTQIDILILTVLVSPEEMAHYYAAARAALVVSFFFGSSAILAEPQLARLFAGGELDGVRRVALSTARAGFLMTVLAALAAIMFAPLYLDLYGPGFRAAFPALAISAAGLVGWSLFGPAQVLMRAARLDSDLLWQTGAAVAINAAATALLVPILGITGAAVGTAFQFVSYGWLLARTVARKTAVRTDLFPIGSRFHFPEENNDKASH